MDFKVLLVVFFYNHIKGFASRLLGGLGLPIDYILLAIGWWKKDTWWGQGLLYGAVASIGATTGGMIFAGLLPATTQPSSQQVMTQSQIIY